jgi:pimeloyl-ACP methyl ester carboxylesterase
VRGGVVIPARSGMAGAAVLIAALAAACGQSAGAGGAAGASAASPGPPAASAGAIPPASAGAIPAAGAGAIPAGTSPVAAACGPPGAPGRLVTVTAADRVRLTAATAGSGRRGVLLIPERGPAGLCGWWAYAARLSRSGYRVLMFDHRCTGDSGCPAGAAGRDLMADIRGSVSWLHRAGAVSVVLMGASQGASEAVIAATRPPSGVTGVVVLSADELTTPLARGPYPRTALAAVPRLRLPVLFAVAAGDPYMSVAATRRLVAAARSPGKRLVVLPEDSGHGWDLVSPTAGTSAGAAFLRTVGAFLARASL